MPKKFIRCVKKVKKSSPNVNPYVVCRKSTGYYGTTHHIGLIHKIKNDKNKIIKGICPVCRSRMIPPDYELAQELGSKPKYYCPICEKNR